MRARVEVKAPWWTSLNGSERSASLEKTKDDGHGGVGQGDTRYAVYVDEDRIGFVFSIKDEKSTRWFAEDLPEQGPLGFSDRFTAIRNLIHKHDSHHRHTALSA